MSKTATKTARHDVGMSKTKPTKPTKEVTMTKPSIFGPQLDTPQSVDQTLVEILARPRCHDTPEEKEFHSWLISRLNQLGYKPTIRAQDAISVEVPRPDGKAASTLFSCHIDTVDRPVAGVLLRKAMDYDSNFGTISLSPTNTVGNCLGADDGAGVWLMLKMIEAKVPGSYIFNRGEEVGGISAKALAMREAEWLRRFAAAVAFDRPRTNEIITHQRSKRTASDKYGTALANALNKLQPEFGYKISDTGVYTDTADFASIISECTNIGVGYTDQHGTREQLDYAHLVALKDACIKLDWEALPADRDPTVLDYKAYEPKGYTPFGGDWRSRETWGSASYNPPKKSKPKLPPLPAPTTTDPELTLEEEIAEYGGLVDWADYASGDPDDVARLLIEAAAELAGLRAEVKTLKRALKSSISSNR